MAFEDTTRSKNTEHVGVDNVMGKVSIYDEIPLEECFNM
jgi:hypothetical protein